MYGLAEQLVYGERGPGEQGLWLFGQVAYADPKVNRFSHYVAGAWSIEDSFSVETSTKRDLALRLLEIASTIRMGNDKKASVWQTKKLLGVVTRDSCVSGSHIQPDIQYSIHPNHQQ